MSFAIPTMFQPQNSTLLSIITPSTLDPPFYHTTRASLFTSISDKHLSLLAPIVIYWALSLTFHALDTAKLPYFEARRIHESPETLSRNKCTVAEVVKAVVLQQVVQTILGLLWLESDEEILHREVLKDHLGAMARLTPTVADGVLLLLGKRSGEQLLRSHGASLVRFVYWWGIPAAQLMFALYVESYFAHNPYISRTDGPALSSTHGSTSCTAYSILRVSFIAISTRSTTASMCLTPLAHYTTIRSKDSCSTLLAQQSLIPCRS
jgi:hypothetical protein